MVAADALVKGLAPRAELIDVINGVRAYQLLKGDVTVGKIFEAIEAEKAKCGITDWGLSQTSLEDVFLTIVSSVDGGAQDDVVLDVKKKGGDPEQGGVQMGEMNLMNFFKMPWQS